MSGETAAVVYDCESCSDEAGKCKREWKFNYCPLCEGKYAKCEICNGSGIIADENCPRSFNLSSVPLSYFFEWYSAANLACLAWPDGQSSIYQPVKLKKAFWLLRACYEYIKKERSKDVN